MFKAALGEGAKLTSAQQHDSRPHRRDYHEGVRQCFARCEYWQRWIRRKDTVPLDTLNEISESALSRLRVGYPEGATLA